MSLVNLAHVCSHMQNASRARLSLTSIPLSKLHLALALALQKQGFISSVQVGGKDPPTPVPDTILPQDAETLTYEDYKRVVKLFESAGVEVRRRLPWSWHSRSVTRQLQRNLAGSEDAERHHGAAGSNVSDSALPSDRWDTTGQMMTTEGADVSTAPSEAVQAAAVASSAASTTPSTTPTPFQVSLPLLTPEEYAERPWLWLYRNNFPTPLAEYLATPSLFLTHPTQQLISFEQWSLLPNSLPHGYQSQSPAVLAAEPWRAYPDPDPFFASVPGGLDPWINVPRNPAQRRLWLGLKYWQNEPVITKMQLVAKPTRRMVLDTSEIGKVARGDAGRSPEGVIVKGLSKIGECLFVRTRGHGLMESRECIERGLGGMPLVRVW